MRPGRCTVAPNLMRAAAIFLLLALPLRADEVELISGDTITDCKVVEDGEYLKISKGGITRNVHRSEVKKWTKKPTLDEMFQEKKGQLRADDLAGTVTLAKWCATVGLPPRAKEMWARVLELDADHAEARAALGYRKVADRWLTEDEEMTARGLVKFRGRWVSPEERDLVLAVEEQKELDKKYLAAIRGHLQKTGHADEAKRAEAEEALAKLDDRSKPRVYLASIADDSKHTRLFVVKELARLAKELKETGAETEWKAVKALARRCIWDEADAVRDAAMTSLMTLSHKDTAVALMAFLGEESRLARLRTEGRLEHFVDLRPVPQLVELLEGNVATIRFLEENQDKIRRFIAGRAVTSDGRVIPIPKNFRFIPSESDREIKERCEEEKQACVRALKSLTGQNHGVDPAAWRAWYESVKRK